LIKYILISSFINKN